MNMCGKCLRSERICKRVVISLWGKDQLIATQSKLQREEKSKSKERESLIGGLIESAQIGNPILP
jgi:hypothetical protein